MSAVPISGRIGGVLLLAIVAVAMLGPIFAPHSIEATVGIPGTGPAPGAPLGTDLLGRDVLSRVLAGGRSVLLLAGTATLLIYLVGVTVGLLAGYFPGWADQTLMRGVDLLLAFPALLLLLVLVSGAGSSDGVLVLGVTLVLFPGVARIVRAAALEVSVKGFVEAAVLRGERVTWILRRELLPNVMPYVVADAGIRFSATIILIASLNFLGLGLEPPAADWGLMISENRPIITGNPYSVVVPALLLAALCVSVNLVGDAYSRRGDR